MRIRTCCPYHQFRALLLEHDDQLWDFGVAYFQTSPSSETSAPQHSRRRLSSSCKARRHLFQDPKWLRFVARTTVRARNRDRNPDDRGHGTRVLPCFRGKRAVTVRGFLPARGRNRTMEFSPDPPGLLTNGFAFRGKTGPVVVAVFFLVGHRNTDELMAYDGGIEGADAVQICRHECITRGRIPWLRLNGCHSILYHIVICKYIYILYICKHISHTHIHPTMSRPGRSSRSWQRSRSKGERSVA